MDILRAAGTCWTFSGGILQGRGEPPVRLSAEGEPLWSALADISGHRAGSSGGSCLPDAAAGSTERDQLFCGSPVHCDDGNPADAGRPYGLSQRVPGHYQYRGCGDAGEDRADDRPEVSRGSLYHHGGDGSCRDMVFPPRERDRDKRGKCGLWHLQHAAGDLSAECGVPVSGREFSSAYLYGGMYRSCAAGAG